MKNIFNVFFELNKSQRIAITILIFIAVSINVISIFITTDFKIKNYSVQALYLDSESQSQKYFFYNYENKNYSQNYKYKPKPGYIENEIPENFNYEALQYFDPNTISKEELQELGINKDAINHIINFRKKGGKFYTPRDLNKITSLTPKELEDLIPWIKIETKTQVENLTLEPTVTKKLLININTDDPQEWAIIKGIGIKTAQKIIAFKNLLGGFHSIEQLKEVWGLDTLYDKIKPSLYNDIADIQKININEVDEKILSKHPYFSYKLAKVIVAYRQQHSGFKNLDELKNIKILEVSIFEKIKPYLKLK